MDATVLVIIAAVIGYDLGMLGYLIFLWLRKAE